MRGFHIAIEPLTAAGFLTFGQLIEVEGEGQTINQGFATSFLTQAAIDTASQDGQTQIRIFAAIPRPAPIKIELMERHPFGSQGFFPLEGRDWLVLVCTDPVSPQSYRCFRASGRQGVNYAKNCWHHPLLVLEQPARFLVVDRKGPGTNLEEVFLDQTLDLSIAPT